jgi:hypothetical protein
VVALAVNCKGCSHWRSIADGNNKCEKACNYYNDTGRTDKVKINGVCQVRDTTPYKPKPFIPLRIMERIMEDTMSNKSKISDREAVINLYKKGNSLSVIAETSNICDDTVKEWIDEYNREKTVVPTADIVEISAEDTKEEPSTVAPAESSEPQTIDLDTSIINDISKNVNISEEDTRVYLNNMASEAYKTRSETDESQRTYFYALIDNMIKYKLHFATIYYTPVEQFNIVPYEIVEAVKHYGIAEVDSLYNFVYNDIKFRGTF